MRPPAVMAISATTAATISGRLDLAGAAGGAAGTACNTFCSASLCRLVMTALRDRNNEMNDEHYWTGFSQSQEMKRLHFIFFWTTVSASLNITSHEDLRPPSPGLAGNVRAQRRQ